MSVLDYATPARTKAPQQLDLRWLAWGPFLGISWTWCIGMFLPVLLIRDYGSPAYWIFALPNVFGAAAMGWVICSPDSSRQIVKQHRSAAVAFSIVTIAFHFYFAAWLVRLLWSSAAIPVLMGASVVLMLLVQLVRWSDRVLSAVAFILSIALVSDLNSHLGFAGSLTQADPVTLFGLSLTCLFGFALCPYLDLTFHRARQQVEVRSRSVAAFAMGFGIFFFYLILLTPDYAKPMWYLLKDGYLLDSEDFIRKLSIYLLMQSSLTVAYHVREVVDLSSLRRAGSGKRTPAIGGALVGLIVCIALATIGGAMMPGGLTIRGLSTGEIGYRYFMGFYGLVFPAYVWLCMIPSRGKSSPTRRMVVVTGIAVLVALPMFWIGFIQQHMGWIIPGVLVVLLARLLVGPTGVVASASTSSTEVQQNSAPIS